jgi:hypothetical protein
LAVGGLVMRPPSLTIADRTTRTQTTNQSHPTVLTAITNIRECGQHVQFRNCGGYLAGCWQTGEVPMVGNDRITSPKHQQQTKATQPWFLQHKGRVSATEKAQDRWIAHADPHIVADVLRVSVAGAALTVSPYGTASHQTLTATKSHATMQCLQPKTPKSR